MSLGLNKDRLINDELANVFSCDKLSVSIIDHLVNDLVDENKILPDALFVEHATVISEDLHHAVDDIKDRRWGNISFARCHEVDSKFLSEKVVDAINVLQPNRKGQI